MCNHEQKICPRCQGQFECKPGSITQCQCFEVRLTAEQRVYIEQRYPDCLCKKCLTDLQKEFELSKEKIIDK